MSEGKKPAAKTKTEILSELDRLRHLLEKDRSDGLEESIPMLDEVVEMVDDANIPLLEEVVAAEGKKQKPPTGKAAEQLPSKQELDKLIETLVILQLRRLRPIVQKEVLRLILERYPKLK